MAHGHSCDRQKVRAIIPLRPRLIGELQIDLVHERGRSQSRIFGAADALAMRDHAKLIIKERGQLVERFAFSGAKPLQQMVVSLSWHQAGFENFVGFAPGFSFSQIGRSDEGSRPEHAGASSGPQHTLTFTIQGEK